MPSFSLVMQMGHLGRDVELRYTAAGTPVCEFPLASNERYKRGEEWIEDVCWIDVTCWGRTAEIAAEYLKKGSGVLIIGRLRQEKWDDKSTGQKRSKHRIVCTELKMLGGKDEGSGRGNRVDGVETFTAPPGEAGTAGGHSPASPPADDPFAGAPQTVLPEAGDIPF